MPPSGQPESARLTLEQKYNIALLLAHLCSLTVVVLLRRKVGIRHLSAGLLVVLALLMFLGNPLDEGSFSAAKATPEPFPYRTALPSDKPVRAGCLGLFAVVALLAAARQRRDRWRDFKRGVSWHSRHRGISWLSFLPLDQSTIARFVEPALCLMVGFACWHWISVALGAWLIFAGLGLRIVEQWVYKQDLARTFDTIDGLVDSEIQGEVVEHYLGRSEQYEGGQEGIPTGYAADVKKTILRRAQTQTTSNGKNESPKRRK